jgi:hypothetical protein
VDVPLALDLELEDGGSNVELGGLWLTEADIRFSRGGFNLQVSEPLREPMENLSLEGMMGGFNAQELGNASPRNLQVDFRIGGMNLDLSGRWMEDSDIFLRWDMGGGKVHLPANVVVVGVDGIEGAGPGGEVPPPTLEFRLSGDMDDMKFTTEDR